MTKTKRPAGRMGPAAKQVLRGRTGAEALEAATNSTSSSARPPASQWGAGRNQAGYKVTTIRFHPDQWRWLRERALGRALESGATADASEIVRELVAAAMQEKGAR